MAPTKNTARKGKGKAAAGTGKPVVPARATPAKVAKVAKATKKKTPTKEWNFTHLPITVEDRKKNGRVEGRNLITWGRPRMAEKLLLNIFYEVNRFKIDMPWDQIAHRLHPGSTGGAIQQYMTRMRSSLIVEGHLVPPVNQKPGSRTVISPTIRGYMRASNEPGQFDVRPVPFTEPCDDARFNMPEEVPSNFREVVLSTAEEEEDEAGAGEEEVEDDMCLDDDDEDNGEDYEDEDEDEVLTDAQEASSAEEDNNEDGHNDNAEVVIESIEESDHEENDEETFDTLAGAVSPTLRGDNAATGQGKQIMFPSQYYGGKIGTFGGVTYTGRPGLTPGSFSGKTPITTGKTVSRKSPISDNSEKSDTPVADEMSSDHEDIADETISDHDDVADETTADHDDVTDETIADHDDVAVTEETVPDHDDVAGKFVPGTYPDNGDILSNIPGESIADTHTAAPSAPSPPAAPSPRANRETNDRAGPGRGSPSPGRGSSSPDRDSSSPEASSAGSSSRSTSPTNDNNRVHRPRGPRRRQHLRSLTRELIETAAERGVGEESGDIVAVEEAAEKARSEALTTDVGSTSHFVRRSVRYSKPSPYNQAPIPPPGPKKDSRASPAGPAIKKARHIAGSSLDGSNEDDKHSDTCRLVSDDEAETEQSAIDPALESVQTAGASQAQAENAASAANMKAQARALARQQIKAAYPHNPYLWDDDNEIIDFSGTAQPVFVAPNSVGRQPEQQPMQDTELEEELTAMSYQLQQSDEQLAAGGHAAYLKSADAGNLTLFSGEAKSLGIDDSYAYSQTNEESSTATGVDEWNWTQPMEADEEE